MKYGRKKITVLLASLILLAAGCSQARRNSDYTIPLRVSNHKIFVSLAKSEEEKRHGLSGQDRLTDEQGMLFDFTGETNARPGFWMKEMKFDLDLIWIKNKKIIGITANVPSPKNAGDKLPLYSPPSAVDMVLEVNAGWSERNGVKAGDEVKLTD